MKLDQSIHAPWKTTLGGQILIKATDQFDIIISDSTDPIGPGESLFTSKFYQSINKCLTQDGVFVAQNGVCFMQMDEVLNSHQRLKPLFKNVSFYSAAVPTYAGGIMTFAWASQTLSPAAVDEKTITRRFKDANISTRYYHPQIHQASFALPQYVNDALEQSHA